MLNINILSVKLNNISNTCFIIDKKVNIHFFKTFMNLFSYLFYVSNIYYVSKI